MKKPTPESIINAIYVFLVSMYLPVSIISNQNTPSVSQLPKGLYEIEKKYIQQT